MNTPTIVSCSRALKLGPGINPVSTKLPITRLSVFSLEGNLLAGVANPLLQGYRRAYVPMLSTERRGEELKKLHTKNRNYDF
jgi:hypothetical protein